LGGIEEVQSSAVWPEIEELLLYAGDEGAGPSGSVIGSELFSAMMDELKSELGTLVGTATKVERFWIQDGHPAYPVFWDFAFLFWEDSKATVLIGSSSD
jgi:hypothetical protein